MARVFGLPSETWFPVITLILGAVLKGVFDLLTERRSENRNRRARIEQRRDTLQAKRIEFQQATLLEVQEVTARLVRMAGRINVHDEMQFRATGDWHGSRLPEEVDQGFLVEQTSFNRLRVRIRDDQAREVAKQFSEAIVNSTLARSQSEAQAHLHEMMGYLITFSERVGVLLRELEIEEIGSA